MVSDLRGSPIILRKTWVILNEGWVEPVDETYAVKKICVIIPNPSGLGRGFHADKVILARPRQSGLGLGFRSAPIACTLEH